MFRQAAVSLLSATPFTRSFLEWARERYLKYKENRFDTCSPDAIPVLDEALELTRGLGGDYYEFGIFKGYLLHHVYRTARRERIDLRVFGFDSFEGLPAPEGIDAGWRFREGMYASSYPKVVRELTRRGVRLGEDAFLIRGFYNEVLRDPGTLGELHFGKARVVTIDCDLYASTRDVLEFIVPYLQAGTILVMDDWNCFDADDERGQRLALREFQKKRPGLELEQLGEFGWHGAYFAVRRLPT